MRAIVGLGVSIATPDEGIRSSPATPAGTPPVPGAVPASTAPTSAAGASNGAHAGGWIAVLAMIAAATRRRRR
jgi:hypothetical protein